MDGAVTELRHALHVLQQHGRTWQDRHRLQRWRNPPQPGAQNALVAQTAISQLGQAIDIGGIGPFLCSNGLSNS